MKHDRPVCTEQIVLRMPPELRDKIESAASAEGRTLANMTRRILERWAAEGQPQREQAAA
jgi:predicted DNA-binding protein